MASPSTTGLAAYWREWERSLRLWVWWLWSSPVQDLLSRGSIKLSSVTTVSSRWLCGIAWWRRPVTFILLSVNRWQVPFRYEGWLRNDPWFLYGEFSRNNKGFLLNVGFLTGDCEDGDGDRKRGTGGWRGESSLWIVIGGWSLSVLPRPLGTFALVDRTLTTSWLFVLRSAFSLFLSVIIGSHRICVAYFGLVASCAL